MQEKKPQQSDFMIEKIKDRPINKKKLLRRTVITAAMAVIFGLIACLTFLLLEPVFSKWLYPQPQEEPIYIEFPEETEEMLPGDMIVEETTPDIQQEVENVLEEGGQIEEALSGWELNKDNYSQLYAAMSNYKKELDSSMVLVTGTSSGTDVFNDTTYSSGQVSGVILADNGVELLILADRTPIMEMDSLSVTFCSNQTVPTYVKQYDSETGLAIFAVPLQTITRQTTDKMTIAELGSSNFANLVGIPVVAMGSPMGVSNSVGYGIINASGKVWSVTDANYKLLLTDIYGSQNASGVLFNYDNKVLGIITTGKNDKGMENLVTALGISELKKVITRMSNAKPEIYMGITGMDMSEEIREATGVPLGVYVTDVIMDSPAMLAGIQKGDVVVSMNDLSISGMSDYTLALLQHEPEDEVTVVVERAVQEEYKQIEIIVTLTGKELK